MQGQASLYEKGNLNTNTGGGHVTTEADTGVMWPQSKDLQSPQQLVGVGRTLLWPQVLTASGFCP